MSWNDGYAKTKQRVISDIRRLDERRRAKDRTHWFDEVANFVILSLLLYGPFIAFFFTRRSAGRASPLTWMDLVAIAWTGLALASLGPLVRLMHWVDHRRRVKP